MCEVGGANPPWSIARHGLCEAGASGAGRRAAAQEKGESMETARHWRGVGLVAPALGFVVGQAGADLQPGD